MAALVLVACLCQACSTDRDAPIGDAGSGAMPDATLDGAADGAASSLAGEQLYDPGRLLEIEIELDDADWDRIRREGRGPVRIFAGCPDRDFAYSEVMASVRIDGELLERVALRKKGYLGSLSAYQPSLKLNFQRHEPGRTYQGMKRLTLNNNRQDPTGARTCLAYSLFERAGVPTPRCGFAHVTVNGQDLGYYSNVEGIKKPFLARVFGDDSGNLYEGQGGDFRSDLLAGLEKKTNEHQADYSDVEALAEALDAPDESLLESIEPWLDVDAFLTFWAVETLSGHWDGYSGDLNNFYVYDDPADGRFRFIPSGPDAAFRDHALLPASAVPRSVLAWARLPQRLYALAETRARYRERLAELLDAVWDEGALNDELERIAALTDAEPRALLELRDWIDVRADEVRAELEGPAPAWLIDPRPTPECNDDSRPISMRFSTTWGSVREPLASPDNALEIELDGQLQTFESLLAGAGPPRADGSGRPTFTVRGTRADGSTLQLFVFVGEPELHAGETLTHGMETVGQLYETPPEEPAQGSLVGFADRGVLTLERLGQREGDVVEGRFEGMFGVIRRSD